MISACSKILQKPFVISLPIEDKQIVKVAGPIQILENLVLQDVLYVPGFKCNLLSVGKLIKDLRCYVLFTPTGCFIQVPSMKIPMKIGDALKDLFTLSSVQPVHASASHVAGSDITALWHSRLGHLPFTRLKCIDICNKSALIKDSVVPCTVCAQARQARLSFPDSEIKSLNAFDIIHVDVWEPYHIATYDG